MPSTSPPVGPDTPAGPPLPNEAALERLFRARYASLAEQAKAHLKDAQSAAPRIVEALFLRAWDERDQFKTVGELDAFLKDEVAHAAARELARRASAHHFGAGRGKQAAAHAEPAADVNKSWERMQHALHPDREAAADAIKQFSKHDAAAHVKQLGRKRNYVVPIVIIVAAIGLSLVIAMYLNRLGREGGIVAALKTADSKAHQTRDAQFANVDLNDGSTVRIGPQTKLVVADNFGDAMRVIQVSGVASVTVSPGHPVPLEVRVFNAVLDAPSGGVVVRTFSDDSSVTLIVKDAADSLRIGKDDRRSLAAGAAVHVSHDGQVRDATPAEVAEAGTWLTDSIAIVNRPLKAALAELQQWYGTKVYAPDSALQTRPITITAPLNSSVAAINAMEKSGGLKFGYEGQSMVFRDGPKK